MPKSDIPPPKSRYKRERERWPEVARTLLGRPPEDRRLTLAMLPQKHFFDIADKAPRSDDVQAYAAFAVKTLLQTLIDKRQGPLEQRGKKAQGRWAQVFGIPHDRKLTDLTTLDFPLLGDLNNFLGGRNGKTK
jgi:hypothetical protein